MIRILNIILISLLFSAVAFGQGTLRGTLLDKTTGETVPFANIFVKESATGTTSDLDGAYEMSLPAGTYTVEFSFIGYANLTIADVIIKDNEVTILDASMAEESTVLAEVVVTAAQVKNTEVAVLTIQKKAPGLLDGISKQSIKRSGDNNVGAAIKRVTGVSVQDGKYVVVRGLGDRYSKTILNGMDVPGLDPDKNSVQLDIFPTNLVDNIIVYKSFTPNLPGDFTGGMVDIITKDFPEEKTLSVSAGASYNPTQHFNNNYISGATGRSDWLGFDDNSRRLHPQIAAIQNDPNREIPAVVGGNGAELYTLTSLFKNNMSTFRKNSGLNHNYSLAYGNQKKLGKYQLGYTLSGNYRNETEYLEGVQFNTFFKDQNDKSINELFQDVSNVADKGSNNVQWSLLAGGAIKSKRSKISLSALHSQNGTSRAAFIDNVNIEFNPSTLQREVLEYTERSVTNVLLAGKHSLGADRAFTLNWSVSPTFSKMDEPDIRQAAYETTNGDFEVNRSVGANVTRTFRNLVENNYTGKVDLEYATAIKDGLKTKVKVGAGGVYKDRDFRIDNFIFPIHRAGLFDLTGNANELFDLDFLWKPDSDRGIYVQGNTVLSNIYNATQQIVSGYAMHEYPFSNKFKAIYGVRVEKVDQRYTGQKQIIRDPSQDVFDNRKILDELNVLPSLSMVYNLKDDNEGKVMNLRGSFSQTLARPSFKEKSIAQIEDRIAGRTFIGNINLEQTNVTNLDLRWENYLPGGQLLSVSGFYKAFENPIELTAFDATSPNSFTPRNVGDASIAGIEFELRRNFSFISENLAPLSFSLNTTLVQSQVEMSQEEISGREIALRTGETLGTTRDMVGQSPYVINAGFTFNEREKGLEASLAYNVQGKRLSIVGIGQVPDVFEAPFHSLNFKVSKVLDAKQNWKASLTVGNILNDKREMFYNSFEAADQLFESFQPGRQIGVSIGYTLR